MNHIDTSVLLENIPLVKFIKTTSGTRVVYFPQSHTWVYRWRNFGNFTLLFCQCLFVYIIKRTLHGGLKIWILFSHGKNNILRKSAASEWNIVLPLENKIRIFAPPCNILYIFNLDEILHQNARYWSDQNSLVLNKLVPTFESVKESESGTIQMKAS